MKLYHYEKQLILYTKNHFKRIDYDRDLKYFAAEHYGLSLESTDDYNVLHMVIDLYQKLIDNDYKGFKIERFISDSFRRSRRERDSNEVSYDDILRQMLSEIQCMQVRGYSDKEDLELGEADLSILHNEKWNIYLIEGGVDLLKSAELIDLKNNHIIATYIQTDNYEVSLSGIVHIANSWEENGKPYETEFFADVIVKWDGCSHFYFYGEDYTKENEEKDSYYHICGVPYYIKFMRVMAFIYELMVNHVGYERILEKEEYDELKQLKLLDGFEIRYYE